MQKAPSHLAMLRPLVGVWFRELFHSLLRVLFTFPSTGTRSLSVSGEYFSLTGWSRQIRAGFLVSRVTQDTAMSQVKLRVGLSPSVDVTFQILPLTIQYNVAVLQPSLAPTSTVWAVPRSLATTGESFILFSLPAGTKMFPVPCVSLSYIGKWPSFRRLLSHSEIFGSSYCTYPEAYRSLSRPSSPP